MALLMERRRWEKRNLAIAVPRRGCWWCLGSCRRGSSNDDGLDAGGKENGCSGVVNKKALSVSVS